MAILEFTMWRNVVVENGMYVSEWVKDIYVWSNETDLRILQNFVSVNNLEKSLLNYKFRRQMVYKFKNNRNK